MTKQEKVIKEVIARYGETINLKKAPYVLIEIIRQYGGVGGGIRSADCAPPGGPPDILEEIARISAELSQISTALKRAPRKRKAKK
jgi:hypothetical protein